MKKIMRSNSISYVIGIHLRMQRVIPPPIVDANRTAIVEKTKLHDNRRRQ